MKTLRTDRVYAPYAAGLGRGAGATSFSPRNSCDESVGSIPAVSAYRSKVRVLRVATGVLAGRVKMLFAVSQQTRPSPALAAATADSGP